VKRRKFIALIAAAGALPLAAGAQQPTKMARVAILSDESPSLGATTFEPFAQGLRDLGWVGGQNIAFEHRYAEGKNETLPDLAAELVRVQPDVILAIGTRAARAAETATPAIPIVFARVSDPVGLGLVPSLARPGGNLTGVSVETRDLAAKWVELLVSAIPDAKRVGILWEPSFPPSGSLLKEIEGAARSLNLQLVPAEVRGPDDIEPARRAVVRQGAGAVIVLPSPVFAGHLQRVAELTANARIPAMFYRREFVEAGGLMSYGTNFSDMYRRAAAYVDKILKGAKPADLPVEQPTRFELVINLKTAQSLGLTLPLTLLGRADEVIE
jgi:putative tryptophan/tyrosine transport system substrate-binding protein